MGGAAQAGSGETRAAPVGVGAAQGVCIPKTSIWQAGPEAEGEEDVVSPPPFPPLTQRLL